MSQENVHILTDTFKMSETILTLTHNDSNNVV
jgi:hypothetical protein